MTLVLATCRNYYTASPYGLEQMTFLSISLVWVVHDAYFHQGSHTKTDVSYMAASEKGLKQTIYRLLVRCTNLWSSSCSGCCVTAIVAQAAHPSTQP